MAYIDPEGLFDGDRFDLAGDEARLWWPHYWCNSNGHGRIELNYRKIIGTAFKRWKTPPTEEQFIRHIDAFREGRLLFVYLHNGVIWGQWWTSAKFLPTYKSAADNRTPAPDPKQFDAWKSEYLAVKAANSISISLFKNPSKTFLPKLNDIGFGVGVDVGVAVGVAGGVVDEPETAEPTPIAPPDAAPKPTQPAPALVIKPIPAEPPKPLALDPVQDHEDFGFQFARIYSNHPYKSQRAAAEARWARILQNHVNPVEMANRIEANHAKWVPFWQQPGQFKPTMAQYLEDEQYTLDPPAARSRDDPDQQKQSLPKSKFALQVEEAKRRSALDEQNATS